MTITDPFTASFHNSLSKPLLGAFAQTYRDQYQGEWTGVESESVDLTGGGAIELGSGGFNIYGAQSADGGTNQSNSQGGGNNNNQGSNENIFG
ncbi:MAG: hypothetical protein IPL23_30715 [Saprospiraceae bacterium]|nr:hypothetical protein [Saprospiraceae bacterium]